MEIVVFGAGSLGSLVGGLLADDHAVTLVGRPDHTDAVRDSGLRLTGAFERTVHPQATADGSNLAGDLALLTVKAFDTEDAARTLATGSFDAICSLQNGMGNEETLARYTDAEILSGTATYGAVLREPGVVECTGLGEIALGPHGGGQSPVSDRLSDTPGDLALTAATDMPRRQWEKLAINAGINPVTALTRRRNRVVLEPAATPISRAATREAARLARERGVSLSNREAVSAMESVAEATAENTSSMLQDVAAGGPTEIDAISGYVADAAAAAGLDAPTNRLLAALVRTTSAKTNLENR
ncbi:ketopantoate reductase family protein [Halobacteria archaeon AArc-dxtr1]|nr:ketopantoate reductase family protein [Halobacteria archaeon AArc-dxtr1]